MAIVFGKEILSCSAKSLRACALPALSIMGPTKFPVITPFMISKVFDRTCDIPRECAIGSTT